MRMAREERAIIQSSSVAEASGTLQNIALRLKAALPTTSAMLARGEAISPGTTKAKRVPKWGKANPGAKELKPAPSGRARVKEHGEAKAKTKAKAKVAGTETRVAGLKAESPNNGAIHVPMTWRTISTSDSIAAHKAKGDRCGLPQRLHALRRVTLRLALPRKVAQQRPMPRVPACEMCV